MSGSAHRVSCNKSCCHGEMWRWNCMGLITSIISFFTPVLSIGSLEKNPQRNDATCPISSHCTLKVWVKWFVKESNPLNISYLLLKVVLFPSQGNTQVACYNTCVSVPLCFSTTIFSPQTLSCCVFSNLSEASEQYSPSLRFLLASEKFPQYSRLSGSPRMGGGVSFSLGAVSALLWFCSTFFLVFYEASVFPFQTLLAYLFKVSFFCLTIKNIHNSRISFCQKAMFIYLFIFCWHSSRG